MTALNDFRRPRVQLVALNVLGDLLSTLKPSHEEDKVCESVECANQSTLIHLRYPAEFAKCCSHSRLYSEAEPLLRKNCGFLRPLWSSPSIYSFLVQIARGSKSVAVNCMQMLGSLVSHVSKDSMDATCLLSFRSLLVP